jgi:hypothetical protein
LRSLTSYEIGIRLYILGWHRPDRPVRQRFGQSGKELFGGHVPIEAQAAPTRQQAGDSRGVTVDGQDTGIGERHDTIGLVTAANGDWQALKIGIWMRI